MAIANRQLPIVNCPLSWRVQEWPMTMDNWQWTRSALLRPGEFSHPGGRDGPEDAVVGEVPIVEGFFAATPGKKGRAVVDAGGKTDAADFGIEQGHAQFLELVKSSLETALGIGEVLMDLVA